LPRGADAVVMQEDVTRSGDRARFSAAPPPGAHVRKRGEDLARGAVAVAAGTRLRPSHVAMIAAADVAWVAVARRPRVTILSTGDELRSPGTPGRPGTIAECNSLGLAAMARAAGADVVVAPFVPDEPNETAAAFDRALAGSDVVVSIGGVSVGDHDLVRGALERVGVGIEFWKVAIKPGKPLAFGRRGDAVVLGVPGNPASAMVTFALFGGPLLRAMQGDARPLPRAWSARLAAPLTRRAGGRTELARAVLEAGGVVRLLANQASGAITTMAQANALAVIPAGTTSLAAGDAVEVFPFEELDA
jgi:molybdopterin molybdotransferase